MKVAMENVILIGCPQGFAPLTSKRHMSPMRRGLMRFLSFYSVFPGLRAPGFEVSVDLFDEIITRVDWEGGENKSKPGKYGGATM